MNILLLTTNLFSVADMTQVSPTITQSLPLSDALTWVGLLLNIASIIVAIIIYKITKATSQKLFEDSVARAIVKAKTMPDKVETNSLNVQLNLKQKRALISKLKHLLKRRRSLNAIEFAILFKRIISEEQIIALIESWRSNSLLQWHGNLENSTSINILNKEGIYESINSCQS